MEPGDIVIYTFVDKRINLEVERPAIITSKSIDSARNLHVFFEDDDTPHCRPLLWNRIEGHAIFGATRERRDVMFGSGPGTWRRK